MQLQCALTAQGSSSKALKGLVGSAAQGSADCRRNWTTAVIPTELVRWNSSHQCGGRRGGANCLGWRKVQSGTERDEGARPEQNRYRFAATRQTVAYECSWSHWRTAETPGCRRLHRRRRLFRGLDIVTIKWATGDLPEECRFLLNTQLMFLKREKDPTSKHFDDDEWIRSLTEAQELTTDIPEDSVMYDQQDVAPKKVRPIQMGEFLRKDVSRRLLREKL